MPDEREMKCKIILDSYVKCMKDHEGVQPSLYDKPFCQDEQFEYIQCRKKLKEKEEPKK